MELADIAPETRIEIKGLFAKAVELDPDDRRTLLANCNSKVRDQLNRLLAQYEQSTAFMRSGAMSTDRVFEYVAYGRRAFSAGELVAGRFLITRFIAEGGMGEIYEAEDRELNELVALKTVRPELAATEGAFELFKSEVQLARRVTHNNVCRVYDVFRHVWEEGATVVFLSMELLRGETLSTYLLNRGPLPPRQVIALLKQVATALDCAHALKIIHRDLKPGNLMLVETESNIPRAVVTDFGLALSVAHQGLGGGGGRAGTPAYMAPEQLHGGDVGPETDLYALGLLICDMLTGSHPMLDSESEAKSKSQLKRWLSSRRNIPLRLRRIIERCLQFRPANRFHSAREVLRALGADSRKRVELWVASGLTAASIAGVAFVFSERLADRVSDSFQLTPETVLSGEPSLSRDGKHVAYMSNRADQQSTDIWIQSSDGGEPLRLTNDHSQDSEPSLSPDGSLVAFRSEKNGGGVYLVHADGTGDRLLVPQGRSPAFSPDGQRLAFWIGAEDSKTAGQLYFYSLRTGTTRQLAADFADARYPSWDAHGGTLLFLGSRTTSAGTQLFDWWAIAPDKNLPTPTGAMKIVRAARIVPDFPPRLTAYRNRFVFSGRKGRMYQLWSLNCSGNSLTAHGTPRQLTESYVHEMAPTTAANGLIAREHASESLHVWQLSPQLVNPEQDPIKLTDGLDPEVNPAITPDERWLFLTRAAPDHQQLFKVNLETHQEQLVYKSAEDKWWPVPNRSGSVVAFESQGDNGASINLLDETGARTICTQCSHPAAWLADGRDLLYTDSEGSFRVIDVQTGASHTVLHALKGSVLSDADWNPATQFLLFASTHEGSRRLFAVRLAASLGKTTGPWIPLTSSAEAGDHPRWSPDGRRFYYLSYSDGYYCVWTKTFDPARQSVGSPAAVKHFHNGRVNPYLTTPAKLNLVVGKKSLYINLGEATSTIWVGHLHWNPLELMLQLPTYFLSPSNPSVTITEPEE